jgi:hypothetical protein
MEGRHFAVFASISVLIIGYIISFYFFSYKLSDGLIPNRLRQFTRNKHLVYLILCVTLVSPFLGGFFYRIGGNLEIGNSIFWGCYIENFWEGSIFLWFFSFLIMTFFLIIGVIKPKLFGFKKRKKLILFFVLHNLYSLFLLILMGIFIPILSGPLSGKNATCW